MTAGVMRSNGREKDTDGRLCPSNLCPPRPNVLSGCVHLSRIYSVCFLLAFHTCFSKFTFFCLQSSTQVAGFYCVGSCLAVSDLSFFSFAFLRVLLNASWRCIVLYYAAFSSSYYLISIFLFFNIRTNFCLLGNFFSSSPPITDCMLFSSLSASILSSLVLPLLLSILKV